MELSDCPDCSDLSEALRSLVDTIEDLRTALENVFECGHNNDCLFCAKKDWIVKNVLGKE